MKSNMNKTEMDLTTGAILPKVILFSGPIVMSSVLQLLFNAADLIVVGRYAGAEALASVGATTSLVNLIVNLFAGVSLGANVVMARAMGEKNADKVDNTAHTSVAMGILCGLFLAVAGYFMAPVILKIMQTPEKIINGSILYLRIYAAGAPFLLTFNFASSILRSIGDTKHPLYYLAFAGVCNVIINIFFVLQLGMGVAGVALATIISEAISMILIMNFLLHYKGTVQLVLSKIKVDFKLLVEILKNGIPAAIQSLIYSISHLLIQSSVNTFGDVAVAGNTAAMNIEGFLYTISLSVYHANVSFTSQNYGAKKKKRILQTLLICELYSTALCVVGGIAFIALGRRLLGFYLTDLAAIEFGMKRVRILCGTACLSAMMDALSGSLRAVGHVVSPAVISFTCAFLFRIVWILTIFQTWHTLEVLYSAYPATWVLAIIVHMICFYYAYKKLDF